MTKDEQTKLTMSLLATSSGARLQELCPEDKAKIGELMKRLAQEKEEKEKLKRELNERSKSYEDTIVTLEEQKKMIASESNELQS